MKNLLIPFDFSEVAKNALDYAVKFSEPDPSITIHLLHVSDGSITNKEINYRFEEVLAKYKSHLYPKLYPFVKKGKLIPTILEIQEELNVDLVIMGTSGAELDEEDLVTRTSLFVQAADLPILVIPEKHKKFRLDTIILSLGQEEIADRSPLYKLLEVSRKFQAKVHVLTVQNTPVLVAHSEVDESNENTLQYFLDMFYSHHSFTENEDIEKGILGYIKKNDMDMLAIMPRTHLKNGEASQGRLTHYLTLHTEVPLLVLN